MSKNSIVKQQYNLSKEMSLDKLVEKVMSAIELDMREKIQSDFAFSTYSHTYLDSRYGVVEQDILIKSLDFKF